jgi:DHA2 family multidrug resistance protein
LLLGTRGIGTMIAMMLVGRMIGKVEPRILLTGGLIASVVSLYYSIDYSPDTSTWTFVWTSVLQGIGLGFMFVPLNTIAFATLPATLRTEGTAMWTLIRNLGSSIGVSIIIAELTNKTSMMHARLMENVTPFNQALADPSVSSILDPTTDVGRALLDNLVTQQATIIAYSNDFKLMTLIALLSFPLILLIRPLPRAVPTEAAHAAMD